MIKKTLLFPNSRYLSLFLLLIFLIFFLSSQSYGDEHQSFDEAWQNLLTYIRNTDQIDYYEASSLYLKVQSLRLREDIEKINKKIRKLKSRPSRNSWRIEELENFKSEKADIKNAIDTAISSPKLKDNPIFTLTELGKILDPDDLDNQTIRGLYLATRGETFSGKSQSDNPESQPTGITSDLRTDTVDALTLMARTLSDSSIGDELTLETLQDELNQKMTSPKGWNHLLLAASTTEKPKEPQKNYFDKEKYPKHTAFLDQLGIEKGVPLDVRSVDLSSKYPPIESQKHSFACAAFSISSDLAYEIGKTLSVRNVHDVDEEVVYAFIQGSTGIKDEVIPPELKGKLTDGEWPRNENQYYELMDIGVASLSKSLELLEVSRANCPNAGHGLPVTQRGIFSFNPAEVQYCIDGHHSLIGEKFDGEFLRLLLNSDIPPMVVIDTDGRYINEDWMRPAAGVMSHVFNVVGHGIDIDPFDLQRKRYFLLRDSKVDPPKHLKISEEELLPRITEVHKITGTHRVKNGK